MFQDKDAGAGELIDGKKFPAWSAGAHTVTVGAPVILASWKWRISAAGTWLCSRWCVASERSRALFLQSIARR